MVAADTVRDATRHVVGSRGPAPPSRHPRPVLPQRRGLTQDRVRQAFEVFRLHPAPLRHTFHDGLDRRLHVLAMRLGPVHLEVALRGLDHVMDEVLQERLVVTGGVSVADGIEKANPSSVRPSSATLLSVASSSSRIWIMAPTTAAASMIGLWHRVIVASRRARIRFDWVRFFGARRINLSARSLSRSRSRS